MANQIGNIIWQLQALATPLTNDEHQPQETRKIDEHCLWQWFEELQFAPESKIVDALNSQCQWLNIERKTIQTQTKRWVESIRQEQKPNAAQALLQQYQLNQAQGVALMAIAEAILRIPDSHTAQLFLNDQLLDQDWQQQLEHSQGLFSKFSQKAMAVAGWISDDHPADFNQLTNLFNKLGIKVASKLVKQMVSILAKEFVIGQTIDQAINNCDTKSQGYSFDCLGEAALSKQEALEYFEQYKKTIIALSKSQEELKAVSIKISALNPQFNSQHFDLIAQTLKQQCLDLCLLAYEHKVQITFDAEEANRLQISLHIYKYLLKHQALNQFDGLGFAVQAYNKAAPATLALLNYWAGEREAMFRIRLVKGAYWDSEIKWAQQQNLAQYPVYTVKDHTDMSYLFCAAWLCHQSNIFCQFATHNALTLASINQLRPSQFEYQRLYGMGKPLYEKSGVFCRVYAPIGNHKQLLPYLIRRLLENGANSSFVNQLFDEQISVHKLSQLPRLSASTLALPSQYLDRPQPTNWPYHYYSFQRQWRSKHNINQKEFWQPLPILACSSFCSENHLINKTSLMNEHIILGKEANIQEHQLENFFIQCKKIETSLTNSHSEENVNNRLLRLNNFVELLKINQVKIIALLQMEAGKTLEDANGEFLEALDFCFQYAQYAKQLKVVDLPHISGERNQLKRLNHGIVLSIAPWNFPLAIYLSQIIAPWLMGNMVIAKPAPQTTILSGFLQQLFIQANIDEVALLICNDSELLNKAVQQCETTAFTGSYETALKIQTQQRANNSGIKKLIAETGGQNVLIADSSAQIDQLVLDITTSTFLSAGQRCSSARVLAISAPIFDLVIEKLKAHLATLTIGPSYLASSDIGPIIDHQTHQRLTKYVSSQKNAWLSHTNTSSPYFSPVLIEIENLNQLDNEQFGPILHLLKFEPNQSEQLVQQINHLHFGLTAGIFSRNLRWAQAIAEQLRVGNVYINRDMVGAQVTCQPFGGLSKSGTGPKAGTLEYLAAFSHSKVITNNISAFGGNADLLNG